MTGARLLADIGGTNARFACATEDGDLIDHRSWPVAHYASFVDALCAYLDETGGAQRYAAAAIAAAGPVRHGTIKLTNATWRIDAADVSRQLNGAPARLMNDLEAVAMALPYLRQEDLLRLGDGPAVRAERDRMIAVNVGTGFGAATILSSDSGWIACPSEAGHMSLGAQNASELCLLGGSDGQSCTIEDVLSGPGLLRVYAMLDRQTGLSRPRRETPGEVIDHTGDDPVARETLHYVTVLLGRVAGDLTLASAAWGGVYLCGSVAREWARVADLSLFRRHFEDKGKMSSRLRATPTTLIVNENPAFIGLAHALLQQA